MKLELKHLYSYAPYGIRILNPMGDNVDINQHFSICYRNNNDITYCKLFLHPLSDLTKEIEHNGEMFKPSFILSRDYKDAEDFVLLIVQIINGTIDDMDIFKTIQYCPFNITQKLFEWHFDVFGLIDIGLAIDINTLDK